MTSKLFSPYLAMIPLLEAQFGETCQASLYCFEKPEGEVLAFAGMLFPERIGSAAPSCLLEIIQSHNGRPQNMLGYINKSFNGLVLRTSWLFLYDSKKKLAGCFGVHINVVAIKMVVSFLEELCRSNNLEDEREAVVNSIGTDTIQSYVSNTVDALMRRQLGLRTFASLEKQEKIALIAELDQKGIFAVKGAVNLVASRINMTKFAIYNYLDEIRTDDPQATQRDSI